MVTECKALVIVFLEPVRNVYVESLTRNLINRNNIVKTTSNEFGSNICITLNVETLKQSELFVKME